MMVAFRTALAALIAYLAGCSAFDVSCNSNYASYFGQDSASGQKTLAEYCQGAIEDVIILAFMDNFPKIDINFDSCDTTFSGSTLLHCPSVATDIKTCQSLGKVILLSMGGADGSYGFTSDSEATTFADTIWNTFLHGTTTNRPFDDAVLDGIDLDIEGGAKTGYAAFTKQLRTHFATDTSKTYYITGAPQCPFPDEYLGDALNNGWFDMVFVQFYNNYCGLNAYPKQFNYDTWDNWAKTQSINKDVKIYIGAPGSQKAAGTGYVDASQLSTIYNAVRSNYTSIGGIMTWDVEQSHLSGMATSIRTMLDAGGSCSKSSSADCTNLTRRKRDLRLQRARQRAARLENMK